MDLRNLLASPAPGLVNLVVEIPAGCRNKYVYNPEAGLMALDRVLHSSVHYPFDYGFVPNTLAEDGSPLDAMVIMDEPTFAGCLIRSRPIGILDMVDGGVHDGKLLCVPEAGLSPGRIRSIRQIAPNQLEEVAEFFRTYQSMEGLPTRILGWLDASAVAELLDHCIQAHLSARGA